MLLCLQKGAPRKDRPDNYGHDVVFRNCSCCGIIACPDCVRIPVRQLDHDDVGKEREGVDGIEEPMPWVVTDVCVHCARFSRVLRP